GVTLENVSTNTTIAPATTTAASTTTTTVAPTTVTTVPQQTQATVTTLPATTSTTTPTPPTTVKSSTVTVTAPANDAIVRGRVGIQAGVTSSRSVFKVRFYVDNRYVGQDYRSPFTLSWNTGRLAPGSNHTISVVATDFFGREIGRDSVNVTIAG
ncbi:MAG: Ig-like domain-containing protein, partial [Thermoleophilia bacterium]